MNARRVCFQVESEFHSRSWSGLGFGSGSWPESLTWSRSWSESWAGSLFVFWSRARSWALV